MQTDEGSKMSSASAVRRLIPVPESPRIILPYERVSAVMGRDDEAFRSPDIQRRANLDSIAAAGALPYQDAIDNPELYRDIDRTGRDFNRAGIQRGFELKRLGLIDGIAVLDVSRVGRTTGETLAAIDTFRDGDRGLFLSSRERIDDTPAGEFQLAVVVAMGQMYSDSIALGWRAVIEDRGASGLHNGTPPVGYDFARDDAGELARPARIVIDPAAAPALREAFERFAAGESARSIRARLSKLDIWHGHSLRRLLANPFYVGDVRLYPYGGKAKARKLIRGAEPVVNKGRHPALLSDAAGEPDRELFELVQQRLAREAHTAKRHIEPVHALGGLAFCASCGRALVSGMTKGIRHLRDANGMQAGCVGMGSASTDELEAAVLDELRRLLGDFKLEVGLQVEKLSKHAASIAERAQLDASILKCQKAITDIDADLYDGKLPPDRHTRLMTRKDEELARLREQLDACDAPADAELSLPEIIAAMNAVLSLWDGATPAERNVLLRAARVIRVKVRQSTYWREPVADRCSVLFSI